METQNLRRAVQRTDSTCLARIMHDSITVVNYPSEGQPFIGFLLDIKQNIIIAVIFTACNLPVVL